MSLLPVNYEPRDYGARCDLCPARRDRQFVPPAPPAKNKIKLVIVGEGPGYREVRERVPFIGKSGILLNRLLSEAGGADVRSHSWVTNAALCQVSDDKKDDAAACCAPRLYKELSAIDASIPIIALGKPAARSLLGIRRIQVARGFVWRTPIISDASIKSAWKTYKKEREKRRKSKVAKLKQIPLSILRLRAVTLEGRKRLEGRLVFPTLHPAFVLRQDTWQVLLKVDLERVVRALRFRALGKELPLADENIPFTIAAKPKNVRRLLAAMGPEVAYDIETNGVDPLTAPILCMAVSDGQNTLVIQPWKPEVHAKLLSQAFAKRSVGGHNVFAFDELALARDGVVFLAELGKRWDSLLAHHAYASHFPQRLDQLVSFYLDSGPWKIKFGRKGAEEKGLLPAQMEPRERAKYNAADAFLNIRAWKAMKPDLKPELEVYSVDRHNAVMCQEMQRNGIPVDLVRKEELSRALRRRAARLLRRMRLLTKKRSFHPNRHEDVRQALFRLFKAPVLDETPTGLPATSVVVLNKLATQSTRAGKLARYILKYRKAHKIRSTYLEFDKAKKLSIPIRNGFVHYSWKAFGTVSGRWSCRFMTLPRVTNPKHPELEDRVREIYAAPEGFCFVYFDLSQAEMRMASQLSGDENFMRICAERDVHSGNAILIFGTEDESMSAQEREAARQVAEWIRTDPKGKGKHFRDIAKSCGFAVNYLAGAETLMTFLQAQKLREPVPLAAVERMLEKLHDAFGTHFRYIDGNIAFVEKNGFLRVPYGGRIRWFGWEAPKPSEIANLPVQGSVAGIMNERLWEIYKRLPKAAKLIAQIHDAAIFFCRVGKATEETKRLIKRTWARPVALPNGRSFVMPIDLKVVLRVSEAA